MNGLPMGRSAGWLSILVVTAVGCPDAAYAQGLGADAPPDAAGTRPQPGYDALGIIAGNFILYPTLSATTSLDSNVYARSRNRQSDASITVTPALSVRNGDPGRSLAVIADARFRRYAKLNRLDDDQYRVEASGRYEIGADTVISTRLGWSLSSISRGTFENDLQVGGPLQQESIKSDISAQHRFNRLTARIGFSGEKFHFDDVRLDDGSRVDQSFRNGRRVGASLGLSYQLSARVAAQVQGRFDSYDYADPRPLSYRDAKAYSITAGGRYEVTRLLLLEMGAGIRKHNFDNPLFEDVSGVALSGRLRWYPSPLLSVRFDLSQTASTSSSALVSAVNATSARIDADYEFKRNVLISAGVEVSHEDYGNLRSTSNLVSFDGRVSWRPNRWLRVTPSMRYEMRRGSSSASSTFDAFRFALAVTLAR